MPTALVPLIDGFEETEAITAIDVMRRGGINVTIAGVGKKKATGMHDITVEAETLLDDVLNESYDALVLPGGPGVMALDKVPGLHGRLQKQASDGKLVAAICAAPSILASAGLLKDKQVSCHPSVNDKLNGGRLSEASVSKADNIITSRGVGTAVEFGLAIVGHVVGEDKSREIADSICWKKEEIETVAADPKYSKNFPL